MDVKSDYNCHTSANNGSDHLFVGDEVDKMNKNSLHEIVIEQILLDYSKPSQKSQSRSLTLTDLSDRLGISGGGGRHSRSRHFQNLDDPLANVGSGNIHDQDQLPNPEEYKVEHASSRKSRSRFTLVTLIGISCLCIGCTMLGVFIGKEQQEQKDLEYQTGMYRNNGGSIASSGDVSTEDGSFRLEQLIHLITSNGWSQKEMFRSASTPQALAANWLANTDKHKLDIDPFSVSLMQRYVLAVFYYSLSGWNGWNNNCKFLTDISECSWNHYVDEHVFSGGILCDDAEDESPTIVKRIVLPNNQLRGTLPTELALLTELESFNFYNNDIDGTIPAAYSKLSNIESLVLNQNRLTGTIPAWFGNNLTKLQVLDLGNNNISGTLPTNMNQITKLNVFNCENCNLGGSLKSLLNVRKLELLNLRNNTIIGELSESLFDSWSNIQELDLSSNLLKGTLPRGLLDNDHLLVVDLHSNEFSGEIYEISQRNNIEVLVLNDNKLSGRIDDWIGSLAKVNHLDLSHNQFTGNGIPSDIGLLTDAKYLDLSGNYLFNRDVIPTAIGLLQNLVYLSIRQTNRVGKIPNELTSLKQLQLLDLNDNHLSGAIPDQIGTLTNLQFLLLRNNKLSGSIPDMFSDLQGLDTLLLDGNLNIIGNTLAVCQPALPKMKLFQANCLQFDDPTLGCPCCTICCDADEAAQDQCDLGSTNFDPISQYKHVRPFYGYDEQDDPISPLNVIFEQDEGELSESEYEDVDVEYEDDINTVHRVDNAVTFEYGS